KAVLYLLAPPGHAEGERVPMGDADSSARIGDPEQVFVETGPETRPVRIVTQEESPEQLLADATGRVGFVVERVVGGVVLVAAHQVEVGEVAYRVRAVRSRHAVIGGEER